MMPRFEANGWQAVVADQFTFSDLRLVTQAICHHIRRLQSVIDNFPPRLVVGYDNRFMGRHFAEVAAEVILQNGLDVYLMDRAAPTPVVSWMISDQVTTGALMLTGADEAAEYNGVKFITSRMAIASEDTTEAIEAEIERLSRLQQPLTQVANPGEKTLVNPKAAYLRHLEDVLDLPAIAAFSGEVTVDYLYGAASGYVREWLRPAGGEIHELHNSPLADFGGAVPALLPDNLDELCQAVRARSHPLALGLALDGDGSNVQVVDDQGRLVPHDQLFALLLDYLVASRGAHEGGAGIVKPQRRDDMAEAVAALHGLPVICAQTSDFRVITTHLVQEMAVLASDGLGGYAYDGHIMERDGLLTGLLVMEMVATRQQPLSQQIQALQARLKP
ncbi:MAG: hypothetical protein ACO1RX_10015 [Candidatus Sericytochromatia bacterium]